MSARLPIVAVVGRPNVGKSTFFNRVVGRQLAIVDDQPGVTRDRNFARADWAGRQFYIVDTGGVIEGSDEPLDRAVREQAMAAVHEADVILLLCDAKLGPHPLDERLADLLRETGRPVLVVANKVDRYPDDTSWLDFWSLGMGEPIPVAAANGRAMGDLLDKIIAALPPVQEVPEDDAIRIAVVGKPNVGKSSFVNKMFGTERMVVSDIPGTTRDAVDTPMTYHGRPLVFVDTAGLRRQSKVKDSLEYYSSLRTARVLEEADVALALVDATEGAIAIQDLRVIEMAWEAGCGVIIVVNKWDLVENKETMTAPNFEKAARERAPFLNWVPFLYTSAKTGQRVHKALDLVLEVQEQRTRRIETHEVNEVLEELTRRQPPPHSRGHAIKIKFGTQVAVDPPEFVLFSNLPRDIPDHYVRYLMNGFRDRWSFMGSPIRIQLRASAPNRVG